jgi:hypothetical protein
MSFDDDAKRAARDQLQYLGSSYIYTPKGQAPLPDTVLAHVMLNVDREREGVDVVYTDRRTEALLLTEEVGKAAKGDVFQDDVDNWIIDEVVRDDGYMIRVVVRDNA